jgi:glycosyltransferase involved in cell wall biosynthesis/SAM-dependent methyltransferase
MTEHRVPKLEWTGERYVPELSGSIRLEHLHRYLLARELSRDRHVLDIACGEGYGSDLLAGVAVRVVGVDIAADVARHAQARYRRPHLSFAAGDCAAMPIADRSMDVIVSFETLEHHDRHDDMMREVKRVLRPGGVLIISSPDRTQYSEEPNYKNPHHARELDRTEFEELLARHFRHVALLGQRIKAGSLVGPLDSGTSAVSFATLDASKPAERADGFRAPLYFIAIASDAPLSRVPSGLLDGGEFMWSADAVAALEASAAAAAQAKLFSDTSTGVLRQEIDRLIGRVGLSEAQVRVLQEEIERRGAAIARIEAAAADLQDLSNRAHSALEDARAELNLVRRAKLSLESENARVVEQFQSEQERAQNLAVSLDEARAALDATHAALTTAEATRGELQRHLAIIEGSHSWRLTAPVRSTRRQLGRAVAAARRGVSRTTRSLYRHAPVPLRAKMGVKGALFRMAPRLFQRTAAYRAWDEQQNQRASVPPPTPAAEPAPSVAVEAPREPMLRFDGTPIEYVPLTTTPGVETSIKAIAFYLPQFHPIPENDVWWGKGFTEWNNVARGKPQFPGHYQPHLPGELGFYDLRLIEVQRRQTELATAYGLHGFCYHHYWFGGTRLLRRPLDQLLAHPELDFPFCLCWANENWTRRWDGLDSEVLIAQNHSPEDDLAFIRDLEPALRDPRYICVDGRPLLVVYRPALLPDPRATAERWREHCRSVGLPDLFLVSAQAFDRAEPRQLGFDAALEFAPNNMGAPRITSEVADVNPEFSGIIYDYSYLVEYSRAYEEPAHHTLFRCVAPMWDNEARRPGRGAVFAGSTPALYREWLENACRHTLARSGGDKPFVFINAWNEWAEGAHLEPDRAHGYAYLQATADALRTFPNRRIRPSIVVVSHDAYFHGAQHLALQLTKTLSSSLGYDVELLLCGPGPLEPEFAKVSRVHDFAPSVPQDTKQRIARELYEQGARLALCNTSVVGDTVAVLKQAGFRVVSMIHELPGLISQYGLEGSVAAIAEHADRVVFPANVVRARFTELTGLAPEKAAVRPQGLLRTNRFNGREGDARIELRHRLGLAPNLRIALAVGFADRRKGIDLFVEVGLNVIKRLDDVVFVWVGHHDADAFSAARARIVVAHADHKFVFPGLTEDPSAFFAGSDVYLMTSREDPFPLVVLDALEASLPTIGFDGAGGFVELLQRDCGVLVPYLDVSAMADNVVRLLGDPAEAARLAANGRDIVRRELSFTDYARDLVSFAEGPHPRISVIVPNFNYARYLPARLRSIVTQTWRPHEIIVLDDASSDASVEIAESILKDAGVRVQIIRNDTNQGVYRQWLRGLREVTGDLVWIAEADDDCAPTFLETLAPAFDDREVVLAYCQSKQIDANGRELAPDYLAWTEDVDASKWRNRYVRGGRDEIRDSLVVKNTIPNVSAVLMRRPDLAAIESQLVTLRNAGDWLTYVHLLERGKIAFVPLSLNFHRRHGSSVTIGQGGLNLMREILQVQRYILDRHQIAPDVEHKRDRHLQDTYEYLGLNVDGPPSYKDHVALSSVALAD